MTCAASRLSSRFTDWAARACVCAPGSDDWRVLLSECTDSSS
jgi:hypothetical protein